MCSASRPKHRRSDISRANGAFVFAEIAVRRRRFEGKSGLRLSSKSVFFEVEQERHFQNGSSGCPNRRCVRSSAMVPDRTEVGIGKRLFLARSLALQPLLRGLTRYCAVNWSELLDVKIGMLACWSETSVAVSSCPNHLANSPSMAVFVIKGRSWRHSNLAVSRLNSEHHRQSQTSSPAIARLVWLGCACTRFSRHFRKQSPIVLTCSCDLGLAETIFGGLPAQSARQRGVFLSSCRLSPTALNPMRAYRSHRLRPKLSAAAKKWHICSRG